MSKSLGLLASTPSGDTIFLRGLALSAIVGPDAWHRTDKAQPIVVDVRVRANLRSAGASDEIIDSVSYSDIAKAVRGAVRDDEDRADPPEDQMVHSRRGWSSLAPLAQHLVGRIIEVVQDWGRVELVLMLPKALPLSEDGVGLVYVAEYQAEHEHLMRLFVNGIKLPCLIGVNAHERVDKQYVLSDLVFWDVSRHSRICEDYSRVLKKVTDVSGAIKLVARYIVDNP